MASDTCEIALASIEDPLSSTGHHVRYNYRRTIGTTPLNLKVHLYCGATLIHTETHTNVSSDNWKDGGFTLSTTEADNITNYGDLRLKFEAYD